MAIPVLVSWPLLLFSIIYSSLFCGHNVVEGARGQVLSQQQSLLLRLKHDLISKATWSVIMVQWNESFDDCCGWPGITQHDGSPTKDGERNNFANCSHSKNDKYPDMYCWFKPSIQCSACKQFEHIEKVCKIKGGQMQQARQVQVAIEAQQNKENLFVDACYVATYSKVAWLIDSGCTQHMTHDVDLFKRLDRSFVSKVRLGNGDFIQVQGKGDVTMKTPSGTKLISNVLYVPEITQNLLSVGQMLENGYSLIFQHKSCKIYDIHGSEILNVEMKHKSFVVEWNKKENDMFHAKDDEVEMLEEDKSRRRLDLDDESAIGM